MMRAWRLTPSWVSGTRSVEGDRRSDMHLPSRRADSEMAAIWRLEAGSELTSPTMYRPTIPLFAQKNRASQIIGTGVGNVINAAWNCAETIVHAIRQEK
jgi:hypothetical protein